MKAKANEWFIRMRDSESSQTEKQAFQSWLSEDPAHRCAYDELDQLWGQLDHVNQNQIIVNDTTLPSHGLDANNSHSSHSAGGIKGTFSRWQQIAVAACFVIAVAAGTYTTSQQPWLVADYRTETGEQKNVTLADGSILRLNTASAISSHFEPQQRKVTLHNGEVHFDVAADSKRPFTIKAGPHKVTVLGTAFNLKYRNGTLEVIVTEHSVKLSTASGEATTIAEGEGLRVSQHGIETLPPETLSRALAWQQDRLAFVNRPLGEVLTELDPYHPGRIVLIDSSIKNTPITAVFHSTDSETILAAIEGSQNINLTHIGNWFTLVESR